MSAVCSSPPSSSRSILILPSSHRPSSFFCAPGAVFLYVRHGKPLSSSCYNCADRYISVQAHELDQKIQDVYKRIQTERKVLEASQLLRQATTNPDVLRRNDAAIREAERSLSYFEDTLRELQSRKLMQSQREDHQRSGSIPSSQVGNKVVSFQPFFISLDPLFSSLHRPLDMVSRRRAAGRQHHQNCALSLAVSLPTMVPLLLSLRPTPTWILSRQTHHIQRPKYPACFIS